MVECDSFPYLNLQDWIVHNIKVYGMNVGLHDGWYRVLNWLGDGAWDKILMYEVKDGKKLVEVLIKKCIEDPFSRDEDEWNEYIECIVEFLNPVIEKIAPHLEEVEKRIKEFRWDDE